MSTERKRDSIQSRKIKCDRCFNELELGDSKLVSFVDHEVSDKGGHEPTPRLCKDCYEIVKYAASPESWQSTAVPDSEKHFYFDKK